MPVGIPRAEGESRSDALAGVQRASTCKTRRCELDAEKKVMVERPTKGDNPQGCGASQTARAGRGASVGINVKLCRVAEGSETNDTSLTREAVCGKSARTV